VQKAALTPMRSAIRASTPADAEAIVALFSERGMVGKFDLQYLTWKYWQPRADWPGPRSFLVTEGNEPIAHAAIVPGTCTWAGRRVATLHMYDWAARAGTGAGVMLLKHVSQMTDALLAIGGGAETLRILPHVGFRAAGVATGYARPLYPMRIMRCGVTWKVLPKLWRALLRRSAAAAPEWSWQARRLAAAEVSQIRSVLPRPIDGLAVTERSVDLFQYILSCPGFPMHLYAVEKGSVIRGYFLLASVAGQARIADCWVESEEPSDWRNLLLCAVAQAKHDPQAAEVVIVGSDPLLAAALQTCGFHARFQIPIQARSTGQKPIPEGTLRVQMLDNDAAYIWECRNVYWG
jgi:hypothetical protein